MLHVVVVFFVWICSGSKSCKVIVVDFFFVNIVFLTFLSPWGMGRRRSFERLFWIEIKCFTTEEDSLDDFPFNLIGFGVNELA